MFLVYIALGQILAIEAFKNLKLKFSTLKEIYEESLNDNIRLSKENSDLNKRLEYLSATGESLDDRFLKFDLETLLLIGELKNYQKFSNEIRGSAHEENEDHLPTKEKLKTDLKELIFSTDPNKKIKTEADLRRKYGSLEDYL